MPYSPQTWVDGNASYPLSAARMTTIETGVQSAASVADQGHRILTTVQRDALGAVTTGTMVYNTTEKQVQIYTGASWVEVNDLDNTNGVPSGLAPFFTAWTTYTPDFNQSGARTKTVNYAAYLKVGRMVIGNVKMTCTQVGAAGNSITSSLPVAPATTEITIGAYWYSSATGRYTGGAIWSGGAVYFIPGATTTAGSLIGSAPSFATANGDVLSFSFSYESAS